MSFKVDYYKEIHIFKESFHHFSSLQKLQQQVKTTFKKLPQYFGFWYIDQDGDHICLSTDEDLKVLQECSKNQKIFIKEISEEAWMLEQEGYEIVDVQKEQIPVQMVKEEPVVEKKIEQIPIKVQDDTKVPQEEKEKKSKIIAQKKEEQKRQNDIAKQNDDKIKKLVQMEVEKSLSMIAEKVKAMIEQPEVKQPEVEKPEVQQPEFDYLSALLNVQQPEQPKVIHHGYICDGCEGPIIGVRYECGICRNFDYCEKCEATIDHIHPFLKIKTLCQAVMIDFVNDKDLNLIQVEQEKQTIRNQDKKEKKSTSDIQPAINNFLGGEKLNQPKVVDLEVLKKAGTISDILGGKPEEYYEVIDLFKGKTLEVIIDHILQQKEHENYKSK